MRILKDLIEHAEETMEEAHDYIVEAHRIRHEHKALADTYAKAAEIHVELYKHLHDRMVAIITEHKEKGNAVPDSMQSMWDYRHGELVADFLEIRVMIEEYRKNY